MLLKLLTHLKHYLGWNGHEKDFVRGHISERCEKRLEKRNPQLFQLYKSIELRKQGKGIELEEPNRYMDALRIIKDSDYPPRALDISGKCDISPYEVRDLLYLGVVEVFWKGRNNRYRYVINETGEGLLIAYEQLLEGGV